MFKRGLCILLVPTFLLSTGGVVLNAHFCHMLGKGDVSVSFQPKKSCCGGMPAENNCCNNEDKLFKIEDDYTPAAAPHIKAPTESGDAGFTVFIGALCSEQVARVFSDHSPPPKPKDPLHILYRAILV